MNKEINTVNKNEVIFSLCHTTARLNPEGWRDAIQAWKDRADHPELVEHVFVIDRATTPEEFNANNEATESLQDNPIFERLKIHFNGARKCCVDGWNLAAKMSEGKFLINVADDLFPPEHWDTLLQGELNKQNKTIVVGENGDGQVLQAVLWGEQEIVLDVETGAPNWAAASTQGGLITFCFMTRKYYERYGYMLHPDYISVYSDNDFTDQAKKDGVVVNCRHLKFEHRHPIYDPNVKTDAVYENQSSSRAWEVGRKVYIKRSQSRGYAVKKKIVICLPGEKYSAVWTMHWTQLFAGLMPFFDLVPLFCYSTNVYVTRASLANAIMECKPSPDYVLWIDDDNLLTFDQFMIMLKDLEDNPHVDSVSAWTWIMGDVFASAAKVSVGYFDGNGGCKALLAEAMMDGSEDLIKVDWTGFPAILMRYEAIAKVGGHKAFQPYKAPNHAFGYYGEDASFCANARDLGVRMYVDRRIKVPHLKLQGVEPILASNPMEIHTNDTEKAVAEFTSREVTA